MTDTLKALVFDLDGTLYFSDELGREIGRIAAVYIARLKGIDTAAAVKLLRETRQRLTRSQGFEASLSIACLDLGGNLEDLHALFAREVNPEGILQRDERVVASLAALGRRYALHLYTNNNRALSSRIMEIIGVDGMFDRVFTIEDSWRPKPDRRVLTELFAGIGLEPGETLFVGDRYDIDLLLPRQMGAQVHLVGRIEDLLALNEITERGQTMSGATKEMLDAILRAMEIEKETFDFYTRAEQKTFNAGGKRIFHWLAKTEEEHYLKLSELYASLENSERWVFYGGSTIELEPDADGHVGFDTGDREALEVAMEIEKKGIAYFGQLIEKTADPEGRSMLTTLLNEEREHLRIIAEKYGALSKG